MCTMWWGRCFVAVTMLLNTTMVSGQVITTFAGNGTLTSTGDGGQATGAGIGLPLKGAFDKYGNFYVGQGASGCRVRKIAPDGIITTIAGTGISGFWGDGGPATAARFKNAQAIAVDSVGNVYVADSYDSRIRKIDITTGIITTIAGDGTYGYGGDGGPATAATFYNILDIGFDNNGDLYIADYNNTRVRKINSAGIVNTIAGTGALTGYGGDGGLAAATSIYGPSGLCFDNEGNLYIADWHSRVMKVNPAGIITTVAGNGVGLSGGDGTPATVAQTRPFKVAFDAAGNLYIAEYNFDKVRKVSPSGIITTFVGTGVGAYSGDGGPATAAEINAPAGLAFDSCGNLYIPCAHDNHIRKVLIDPFCDNPAALWAQRVTTRGELSIYPNPANDVLHVNAPGKVSSIAILNLTGQTVFSNEYDNEQVEVNIGQLPTGVYFIKVNGTEIRKFVKR